ncbi:GIY-YIG nuclease family protein [Crateriforma conspicua]|uniref:GIY-YIG nuclease family protein n=1 Tax=Crateriforma conspicua TaxID=2527996 RepID=UPI00118AE1A8|nr:GIY-YIG nuclease family protein [Crateriforma conspicua]QDV61942.1 UvrABC system protein C [Crateriforma conspicua]
MDKDVLLGHSPVTDFGIDPLNPHPRRRIEIVGGQRSDELRTQILRNCPRVPGVYGMLCRRGELIYVGKSKSLRSRLLSYFADSNTENKGGRIIESTRAIQWETQPSDFAALLREQQLIRRYSPRWNVQGVPQRQRPVYLCLGRQPAATFFLTAIPPKDCVAVEGPFHGTKRMNVAVDALNKVFRLRDCSQQQVFHFAEQMQLFDLDHRAGCLRLELDTCMGPCAAACTREAYDVQVNAAQSFLDGFNDEPLVKIRDQMERAAENRQYELASRSRDTLKSLEYVNRKLTYLAKARRDYSFVYAASSFDGCSTWYLIRGGEVADVLPAPRNPVEYAELKPKLKVWQATLASGADRGHGRFSETLSVVASWFKKNRGELKRTFAPEQSGRRYFRRSLSSIAS